MPGFTKATPRSRRAKILVFGEAGVGKTHFALTAPKPAVIDAEGGADWFTDRFAFDIATTKSVIDARSLVESIRQRSGDYETIVIDSLSSLYDTLLHAVAGPGGEMRPLEWGKVKRTFSGLIDQLYYKSGKHVVCTARIKPEYAKPGDIVPGRREPVKDNELVKIGETVDCDRKAIYAFDFVFRLELDRNKPLGKGRYSAVCTKSRSGAIKDGTRFDDFSWKTIEHLFSDSGVDQSGDTEDEAAERDRPVIESEGDNGKVQPKDESPSVRDLYATFLKTGRTDVEWRAFVTSLFGGNAKVLLEGSAESRIRCFKEIAKMRPVAQVEKEPPSLDEQAEQAGLPLA